MEGLFSAHLPRESQMTIKVTIKVTYELANQVISVVSKNLTGDLPPRPHARSLYLEGGDETHNGFANY